MYIFIMQVVDFENVLPGNDAAHGDEARQGVRLVLRAHDLPGQLVPERVRGRRLWQGGRSHRPHARARSGKKEDDNLCKV